MKTEQPLWGRGQMVSPQHFQQQAAYAAWSAECIARLGLSHPWGMIDATFEPDALKLGRLQARHLHIRFPDGTLIDTDNADSLPPVLALEGESQEVVVVLALPLLRANGGNCLKPDEVAERPVRYRQRWRDVRNTFGDDTRQIAVMQPELTLRFAHQNNSDYLTCPVARLQQDSQGSWALDETFLPPLLALQGSLWLVTQLEQLMMQLRARLSRLMDMRRESNERMADFAVADVSLFWLLNALNSAEPVLGQFQRHPQSPPERLYPELARLAGSLLTFSLEHQVSAIPVWQHEQLNDVFPPLFDLLGVKLFIYGFSRGAAEARTFINWLTQLPAPDKAVGNQPITLAGLPVSIEFVGLLDTVASVGAAHIVPGAAGHMGWADDTQPLPDEAKFPGLIKCCRHFVAAHEQRLCFPLDSIRRAKDGSYPSYSYEVIYPGMHSDVGGGYPPGDQGKSLDNSGELLSQIVLHDMYAAAFEAGAPLSVDESNVTEVIKNISPSRVLSASTRDEFDFSKALVNRFNIWRQTLLNTTFQGNKEDADNEEGYRPYQLSQTLESAVIEQIGWITAWRIGRYANGSVLAQNFFDKAPQLKDSELKAEKEEHEAEVKKLAERRAEAKKMRKPLDESLQGKPGLDPTNAQYQLREAAREFQHDYKNWVRDINGQSLWDKPLQIALDVIPKHAVFLINGDDEAAEYQEMKADGNRLYLQLFTDKLGTGIRTQPRAELLALYDEQIHDSRAWFMQSSLGGREPWGGYFRYRMIYCGNKANKKLQLISVEGKVVGAQPTSNRVVYLVEPKSAYKGEVHKVTDLATGSTQTLTASAQSASGYEPGSVASQTRSDTINEQHQAMMSSSIDMLKASGVKVL